MFGTFSDPTQTADISESGTDKHQGRASIRKRANAFRSAPDLPVQPFHGIVGLEYVANALLGSPYKSGFHKPHVSTFPASFSFKSFVSR